MFPVSLFASNPDVSVRRLKSGSVNQVVGLVARKPNEKERFPTDYFRRDTRIVGLKGAQVRQGGCPRGCCS